MALISFVSVNRSLTDEIDYAKFSSAPMGCCTATGVAPSRFSICSRTRSKRLRAVHLVDETDARYFDLTGAATVSDWGSTPK